MKAYPCALCRALSTLVPAVAVFWLFVVFSLDARGETPRWVQRDGYREAALNVPATGRTGFTLLTPLQTGIFFTNTHTYDRAEANQNLMNGCGVAAGDFDGDGLCDLYFAKTEEGNGLFRNLGGWRFENVTVAAGVACSNQASKGVVFADINGDGRLDLLAGALGGSNALFLNLGDGRFTNVTAAAGLLSKAGTHSLALADVDGDGDLDLYAANYGEFSILRSGGNFSTRKINGRDVVTGRWARRLKIVDGQLIELGEPHTLYLNDGKGVFTPVSWTGGAFLSEDGQPLKAEPMDMGLSVMFRDINGDGIPDLYVCNDFQTPDRIWIGDGRGHFRALPDLAIRSLPHFSMGVDFADIDRDGFDDFFVGDMLSPSHRLRMTQIGATNPPASQLGETVDRRQIRRNVLSLNRGDGTYANIACFAGVEATDWTWSVVFLDVDLDGFEDLLTVNGHAYDTQDLDMIEKAPTAMGTGNNRQIGKSLRDFPPLITPNYAFRNRGDRTFQETGVAWGFHSTNVSHGLALADFDNDGDLDVAVSCMWQPPLLYRNESTAPRVAVRLRGRPPNTQGIGARVKVLGGAVPMQSQEIQCGGRYLSADDPMRTFAAGSLTNELTIEVIWRSGQRSVITSAKPNHIYEVDEASAKPAPLTHHVPRNTPAFKDVSELLNHVHVETAFNDFERQPLLYRSLAHSGPGVAWIDLDGDGHDELVIAGGQGGQTAIFGGDGKGGFKRWSAEALAHPLAHDLGGLAAWSPAPGKMALLAGLSNYRDGSTNTPALSQFWVKNVSGGATVSVSEFPGARLPQSAAGPVAVADLDGDGDLDVFIGGRVVPGRYPEAASSMIYRNDGGVLKPDEVNSALLRNAGLVSGAVFSDLNGDGLPDLILACEWGPLKIFLNEKGRLTSWNPLVITPVVSRGAQPETRNPKPETLLDLTGWWNSVTTGDFDGDGQLDIVAGNWGLNSSFHDPAREPLRLYHGDFDGNGTFDLLETEIDREDDRLVPRRDLIWMTAGWPALRERFQKHRAYATADVPAVLGAQAGRARELRADALASMIFLNRGTRFDAMRLPDEAQWAPVFGMSVADFDGDGAEDIFLGQNFFAMRPEEPRLDAGRGLWLRGDGAGGFKAVTGQDSGVKLTGEQRGSAVGDYDGDGRMDLVVAQYGGVTRLYHNETGHPGLRVRLQGPPGNPAGIGAVVRLVFGGKQGPARPVQGGSGYWSQDSAVVVLATPQTPASVSVRWPGGKTTTAEVLAGAAEVAVNFDGKAVKLR